MSSLAPAPRRPGPAFPDLSSRVTGTGERAGLILSLLAAAGLILLAAGTTSGSDLAPNTWTELGLIALGTVLAAVAIVRRVRLAGWGAVSLGAFAVLAALTAASIAWSVTPDLSWLEGARTISYLAAFGSAALLARLFPDRWTALLVTIGTAAVALTVWALVVKVFTLQAGGQLQYGRLLAPFGYWNATGTMAGMGMPVLLWAGSRRTSGRLLRALSVPILAVLGSVVILSYSRTALAAALVGLAVPLLFGRTRLRGVALLALAAAGAAVICAWALRNSALTSDHAQLAARRSADSSFGLVLVIAFVVLGVVGFGLAVGMDRITLSSRARRGIGTVLIVAAAMVPVAGVVALAMSSRGLTGEVSHVWNTLTSSQTHVGDKASRLVNLANSRPRYWRQGLSVAEHHLLLGAGAGSFGTAHLRYPTATLTVTNAQHAHSYVFETLADLGLVGLVLSLVLLVSWIGAAAQTFRARRGPGLGAGERDGLWTLLAVALVFGVSSSFDWTWFYPGLAVPALLCAGWLAGRAAWPRAGRAGPAIRASGTTGPSATAALATRPGSVLGLTALLVAAIALGFGIWQPLSSADSTNAGINAITSGHGGQAIADARAAASADPVSLEPLQELSALYDATGNRGAASAELVKATTVQPENPIPWGWLGSYEVQQHHYGQAVSALRRAARLDITNVPVRQQLAQAERQLSSGHP